MAGSNRPLHIDQGANRLKRVITMLLKAAINGRRTPGEHRATPVTPGQCAGEAARAVRAGAGAIHVHPRGSDGRESLAPDDVAAALEAIRAVCPSTPIGVSTGALP